MENPEYILTDTQIHKLMQEIILQYPDDAGTSTLIEAEALAVFAAAPLSIPSMMQEKKMLQQLKGGLSNTLKWLLGSVTLAAAVGTAYQFNSKITPSDAHTTQTVAPLPPAANNQAAPAQIMASAQSNPEPAKNNINLAAQPQQPAMVVPEPAPANAQAPQPLPPALSGLPLNTLWHGADVRGETPSGVQIDTAFAGVTRVEVNTSYGDVQLNAVPGDKVTLSGKMDVETKGVVSHKPELVILYEQQGSLLKVWVENKNKHKSSFTMGNLHISGHLNFQVPPSTDVVVHNASGNIAATGLQGKICQLNSSYGSIRATDIGCDIFIESASGHVTIDNVKGNVKANSSYGNQQFSNVQGQLKTVCASGNVSVSSLKGDADIQASYGNVQVNESKGDLNIRSGSGKVSILDAEGHTVKVLASYGVVSANKVEADLTITSQSGNISLARIKGAMKLTANYGHISLSDCKGRIEADLTSGNLTGSNIELKEGLDISSSYGNVQMQLQNSFSDLSFDLHSSYGKILVNKNGKQFNAKDGSITAGDGAIRVKCSTTSGNQVFQ